MIWCKKFREVRTDMSGSMCVCVCIISQWELHFVLHFQWQFCSVSARCSLLRLLSSSARAYTLPASTETIGRLCAGIELNAVVVVCWATTTVAPTFCDTAGAGRFSFVSLVQLAPFGRSVASFFSHQFICGRILETHSSVLNATNATAMCRSGARSPTVAYSTRCKCLPLAYQPMILQFRCDEMTLSVNRVSFFGSALPPAPPYREFVRERDRLA